MVRDYDIGQVWDILSELDRSVDEAKIRESNHVRDSFDLRSGFLDRNIVYDSLIKNNPVLIGKSNYNTFKVIYEHPTKSSEDVYVIISLDDNGNILIVTVYTHSNDRRIRHHESP
jgi:hypothetical protein